MPWSNQTGNGGWKGGGGGSGGGNGGGGPWGQGPQSPRPGGGGGGGGNGAPDLEEILRRGQDRLRRAMPGGGGGGGGLGTGGGVALGGLVVAALLGIWVFNAVRFIEPDERGVRLVFGQPSDEILTDGLHFIFWPVQTLETVPASETRISLSGPANQQGGGNRTGAQMLSGDQNLVDVEFSVLYRVSDPQAYLFNVDDPQGMLRQVSESAMREVVGRSPVEELFRADRVGIAEEVRAITQATLDTYGTGIEVRNIAIEDTAPPAEVAGAFEEVQRARQDQTRFVSEAQQFQNQRLGDARSQAVEIREAAAAYADRVVQEAAGESQRFSSVLAEYAAAPDVTRRRLYLETMEAVLGGSNMVLVDENAGGGQGVVPYLPLTEVERQNRQRSNSGGTGGSSPSQPNTNPQSGEGRAPSGPSISSATGPSLAQGGTR